MPDAADENRPAPDLSWWTALALGLAVAIAAKKPLRQPLRRSRPGGSSPHGPGSSSSPDGRSARAPIELGRRAWKDIAWRVYAELGNDRVLAVAASVTFYTLLAIFPAVAALVSLYGLFADPGTITQQLDSLSSLLPSGALDIIGEQVRHIASKPHGSLGFGFATGLAIALWSANAGVKALFDALNIVYEEKEKRGFIALNAVSLLFTTGALGIILLALGAVVVIPVVLNLAGLGPLLAVVISLVRWPILLLVIVGALSLLYRFGPSRRRPRWRWVTWGSAAAAVGWLAGSMLFSLYVSRFGTYNETYGSLGAAIGFMTWIWISTTIVLVGAEINAEMEHQTAVDTTQGSGKPIGTRGATMADEVA